MRLRTLGLAIVAWACASAHAFALDFCAILNAPDYDGLSRMAEQNGCRIDGEDGLNFRSFDCSSGQWIMMARASSYGADLTIILPAGKFAGQLDGTRGCDADWTAESHPYDNRLVLKVFRQVPSYSSRKAVALFGIGDRAYFVWICSDQISCRSLSSELGEALEAMLGSRVLSFSATDIRVAGIDITQAPIQDLQAALIARGGVVTPLQEPTSFGTAETYHGVSGVPGLTAVDVHSFSGMITTVKYAIPKLEEYQQFSATLDDRYGKSTRVQHEGCSIRRWGNGGLKIIGKYCQAKPSDTGFYFLNVGAAEVLSGVSKIMKSPDSAPAEERPRPRTDMY